jgi:hypothetical protein
MALPVWTDLAEMARKARGPLQVMVHNIFRQSVLLDAARFKTITGAAEDYATTRVLPEPQRRAINAQFSRSRGSSDRDHEALRVYGGLVGHDRAAAQMGLADPVTAIRDYTRSIRLLIDYDMIYGDPDTSSLQMAGLQYWAEDSGVTSETSISAGSTANGAALSVKLLRNAIDNCHPEPSFIVCGEPMRNVLTGGSEDVDLTGFVTFGEAWGRRLAFFDGLPIITLKRDYQNTRILDFTEAAASGTATATSLYIVAHDEDAGWYPFQNGAGMAAPVDLGAIASFDEQELTWLLATARVDPRAVVRVKHIGNLAMAA